jgi:hypothetical protein
VERALALDRLADPEAVARVWVNPIDALSHLSQVSVDGAVAARLAHGAAVALPPGTEPSGAIAVTTGGRLVAMAEAEEGWLRPRKVFV